MKKLIASIFGFKGTIGQKECLLKVLLLTVISSLSFFLIYLFSSTFLGIFLKPETFVCFNESYCIGCCAACGAVVAVGILALYFRRLNDIGLPGILVFVLPLGHVAMVVWFYEVSESSRIIALFILAAIDIAIPLLPKMEMKKETKYEPGFVSTSST